MSATTNWELILRVQLWTSNEFIVQTTGPYGELAMANWLWRTSIWRTGDYGKLAYGKLVLGETLYSRCIIYYLGIWAARSHLMCQSYFIIYRTFFTYKKISVENGKKIEGGSFPINYHQFSEGSQLGLLLKINHIHPEIKINSPLLEMWYYFSPLKWTYLFWILKWKKFKQSLSTFYPSSFIITLL